MKFKFEFIVFIITAALILNTYYDGKYFKMVETTNARKYIKMATIGFFGLSMYLFMKKNPANSQTIMHHANELIKYMPISRESADMLTPFFDMTNKRAFFNKGDLLVVKRMGKAIRDPHTGEFLSNEHTEVGKAEITYVDERIARAKVSGSLQLDAKMIAGNNYQVWRTGESTDDFFAGLTGGSSNGDKGKKSKKLFVTDDDDED